MIVFHFHSSPLAYPELDARSGALEHGNVCLGGEIRQAVLGGCSGRYLRGDVRAMFFGNNCQNELPVKNQAACFADSTTFIRCQSYGNSLPQSRQTMYVVADGFPCDEGAPGLLDVMGKVQWW